MEKGIRTHTIPVGYCLMVFTGDQLPDHLAAGYDQDQKRVDYEGEKPEIQ